LDTLRTVLESKIGTVSQGIGGIGISYIEMIPLGLRIGILTAIFISVWRNLLKEIRNN